MSQQTRKLYVHPNGDNDSNAQLCAEIVSSARLDSLANSNLPLKTRGAKGDKQVRITVKVETVKKRSQAQQAAAEVKDIDKFVGALSSKGWEHLIAVCSQKARNDIRARFARRASDEAAR